ncbi:MAG: TspO/MBR family protein [Crocinitomicaceae bacterium]|nr:tryptophan-rich sensory protein [Crocinitomicaceae bacterium]
MKLWTSIIFILSNFIALAIGAYLMGDGVPAEWYQSLNKAPWTPPGWVFGAAWTFIMVCFGVFMGIAWHNVTSRKNLLLLYIIHWILNVAWNPIFFDQHWVLFGLVEIVCLWALMIYFILNYQQKMKWATALVYPYVIWLTIATSLNAYIYAWN